MNIKKFFLLSFTIDIIVIAYFLYINEYIFLLNSQVGFFASSTIIYLTYLSYKINILKTSALHKENKEKELSKEIKKSFKARSFLSYISLYRIIGYMIFIYVTMYLMQNNLFSVVPFTIGLFILPVAILGILFIARVR